MSVAIRFVDVEVTEPNFGAMNEWEQLYPKIDLGPNEHIASITEHLHTSGTMDCMHTVVARVWIAAA